MLEKIFGTPLENEMYRDRKGAYGVIFSTEYKIATVRTTKGNFLLGGGVENNESYEECLKRECLEEAGFQIKIKGFICKSETYTFSDSLGCYLHPIACYYIAELKEKVQNPIEPDHELEWISVEDLEDKMYLDAQIWAVKQAIDFLSSKSE